MFVFYKCSNFNLTGDTYVLSGKDVDSALYVSHSHTAADVCSHTLYPNLTEEVDNTRLLVVIFISIQPVHPQYLTIQRGGGGGET